MPSADAPVDLHAHTIVSDGTLAPAQLVELALERGLAALALTDHDHVGGIAEARRAAAGRLEVVSGIELSAAHGDEDVHLLGYLLDEEDPALLARLEALREARARRVWGIVEKLQQAGVAIAIEDVAQEAGAGAAAMGRPHVARALMRRGHVASVQEAFDRYLAKGRPAYVAKEKLTLADAIALVHAAGGVAVIAHPGLLPEATRAAVLTEAIAAGLDGVEVEHPKNEPQVREEMAALARAHGLVATGGSDFHGENKPDVQLGSGIGGNVRVTTRALEALRLARVGRARRSV